MRDWGPGYISSQASVSPSVEWGRVDLWRFLSALSSSDSSGLPTVGGAAGTWVGWVRAPLLLPFLGAGAEGVMGTNSREEAKLSGPQGGVFYAGRAFVIQSPPVPGALGWGEVDLVGKGAVSLQS